MAFADGVMETATSAASLRRGWRALIRVRAGLRGGICADIIMFMSHDSPKLAMSTGPNDVVFHARITPHRSLGARGLFILFSTLVALTAFISVPFYLVGALPVVGFLGLDVLLLWVAFSVSNARTRACEELVVTYAELMVRRVSWKGHAREWHFNPLWVKIRTEEHAEFGMQRLTLVEGQRGVELAQVLGAEEKADFAGALRSALSEAKRGAR
jgi:uncharacterized membrane protein